MKIYTNNLSVRTLLIILKNLSLKIPLIQFIIKLNYIKIYSRQVSLCMMYIWFACAIGYYGLFLSVDRLVDNIALNIFINGALELIPTSIAVLVIPRYGQILLIS